MGCWIVASNQLGRDRSVHHIVSDLETHIRQLGCNLRLNEAGDHASNVHRDYLIQLKAAVVWLCRHVSHDHVGEDVLADLSSSFRDDRLVALARVHHDPVAFLVFMLVEGRHNAAI